MEGEPEALTAFGRPSRKAAAAAIEAHVAVTKGEPLKRALAEALADRGGKLGGQERRFAAFACRELSRHQRWLDQQARERLRRRGLLEDEAIARYAIWRKLKTGATDDRVMVEVKLPGPVRPRSIKDGEVLAMLKAATPPESESADPIERAAAKHSFPRWLSERLARDLPADELDALFAALNREPELILRARPPGARSEVLAELRAAGLEVEALSEAPDALLARSHAVFDSTLMKRGRLQVQDLGSQLIVEHCGRLEGVRVADVCAGAGGKTLALADRAAHVFAGDASSRRLEEAKRRVREMNLRNVSFSVPARCEEAAVVLVDAPCSGSGSIAREPDLKWKLTAKRVDELQKTQLQILDEVARRAAAARTLVYATCSLLREENDDVVKAFVAAHPQWAMDGDPLRVLPHRHPGGGFFAARLIRSPGDAHDPSALA